MTFEPIKIAGEGITVDHIIWRRYKRRMPGLLEMTLDLNPGLAEKGPVLPIGTRFRLPIVETKRQGIEIDVIRLWE